MTAEWIFDDAPRDKVLQQAGFAPEMQAYLHDAARRIGYARDLRSAFLEEEPHYRAGTLQVSPHAEDWGWCALLVVAGFPGMFDEHKRRGVGLKITRATTADLPRWIHDHHTKRTHRPDLPLSWFRKHLKYGLLELGGLQFLPRTFDGTVHVYSRADPGSAPVALASNGVICTADGWPGVGADGFVTTLDPSSTEVTGHPVDPETGQYMPLSIHLDLSQWSLRLSPGDPVLDVHIPSAASLTPEQSKIAFDAAAEVFGRCFPEVAWRAFTCTSWLLDRELHHCLPPLSKILRFGRCFHPFPPKETNCHQFMERVFANTANWRSFSARTSLQKAAQAHFLIGGTFRTTSGYRLREHVLPAIPTGQIG